jgi:hypothetical protein
MLGSFEISTCSAHSRYLQPQSHTYDGRVMMVDKEEEEDAHDPKPMMTTKLIRWTMMMIFHLLLISFRVGVVLHVEGLELRPGPAVRAREGPLLLGHLEGHITPQALPVVPVLAVQRACLLAALQRVLCWQGRGHG